MQNVLKNRKITRKRRVYRVRKKLRGNAEKPRLSVHKSNKNLCAQIIDDDKGVTIVGASTLSLESAKNKATAAVQLGDKIAKLALEKNVKRVVFDRGRFKFHGLIAKLADSARKAGLEF